MDIERLIFTTEFLSKIECPIFIKEIGEDGVLLYCNPAFFNFTGTDEKTLINHRVGGFLQKRWGEIFQDANWAKAEIALVFGNINPSSLPTQTPSDLTRRLEIFVWLARTNQSKSIKKKTALSQHYPNARKLTKELTKQLTKREVDVLEHLATGKTIRTIASLLEIAPDTVADHVKSIYAKMGVHSRAEVIQKTFKKTFTDPMLINE